jgi:hypothetical protein
MFWQPDQTYCLNMEFFILFFFPLNMDDCWFLLHWNSHFGCIRNFLLKKMLIHVRPSISRLGLYPLGTAFGELAPTLAPQ